MVNTGSGHSVADIHKEQWEPGKWGSRGDGVQVVVFLSCLENGQFMKQRRRASRLGPDHKSCEPMCRNLGFQILVNI